ncbi:MAG: hypothetical protein K2P33_10990 [Acutalibacter sp.]|nr:hypothetical protein [Acutalibacter sp.]
MNITGVTARNAVYNGQSQVGYTGIPYAEGAKVKVTYSGRNGTSYNSSAQPRKADCEYFLKTGKQSTKYLWGQDVVAHIEEMRKRYDFLPEELEWLTMKEIDNYAKRMVPQYQVVVYHPTENGFDEKLAYQTLNEAQQIARQYVFGEKDEDGFQYEGATGWDLQERQWLHVEGHFPVPEGDKELPYLPYKVEDKPAQAQEEQAWREHSPTVQDKLTQKTNTPKDLTDLQKKALEIAKRYEDLPVQEKMGIIARTFGCTAGQIETFPCTGKWRGTSDISICFDNGVSLFTGNESTPKAKTAKIQRETINRGCWHRRIELRRSGMAAVSGAITPLGGIWT